MIDVLNHVRRTRGFWCLFDESQHREAYADHFECLLEIADVRYERRADQVRRATPKSRELLRQHLLKEKRPSKSFEFFDAETRGAAVGREFEGVTTLLRGNQRKGPPPYSNQQFFLEAGRPDQEVLRWMLDLARSVPVRYAVGGWLLSGEGTRDELQALCERYVGATFWDQHAALAGQGIRDTNWLTLVASSILERVGGISAARKALSPEIVIHRVLDGYVFQAGPWSLLGEQSERDDFAFYEQVARFLAPCRDSIARWGPHEGPLAHEQVVRWIDRFDSGASREPLPPAPILMGDEALTAVLTQALGELGEGGRFLLDNPIGLQVMKAQMMAEFARDPDQARAFAESMRDAPLPNSIVETVPKQVRAKRQAKPKGSNKT